VPLGRRRAALLPGRTARLGRDAGLAQRLDRRAACALRELLPVLAEDQAVVDERRRRRAERLEQAPVELFVRAVLAAADDQVDAEVDVVDDAREVVRRRPVVAHERDAVEAIAELRGRLEVPLPT